MKKTIVCLGLTLLSLAGKVCAQGNYQTAYYKNMNRSKTDKTFNIWDLQVNIKDYVQLKDGKMILDLHNIKDYENFRNIDSLLMDFKRDIAFYKDSLAMHGAGNVRIDYVLSPEYSYRKIRFKKHEPDGDIYVNRSGAVAQLKLEQDTVRIIIEKLFYKAKCTLPYNIQATFILDNYTDVDKIIADKAEMRRIIDTLEKESTTKKSLKPNMYPEMTIRYNPYTVGKKSMLKYKGVEESPFDNWHKNDYLTIGGNIGAGLVMNTFTPTAEIGISFMSPWKHGSKNVSFFNAFLSSYYFFERDAAGSISIKDNWFVTACIGTKYDHSSDNWPGQITDFGVGYLVSQKGNYFKNTTMKVFTDIKINNGITIAPELIFTNNFTQIFPGLTLKVW